MIKLLLAPLLALCLAACGGLVAATTGLPSSPQAAADRTVLDEQAALSVELAYKAARTTLEVAVDAGLLKGARASQAAAADNKAYAAVQAVRTAYRAGNAPGYLAAVKEARATIAAFLAVAR